MLVEFTSTYTFSVSPLVEANLFRFFNRLFIYKLPLEIQL